MECQSSVHLKDPGFSSKLSMVLQYIKKNLNTVEGCRIIRNRMAKKNARCHAF